MKILMVHDHYAIRGGEDTCFDRETKLLSNNGVEVITYTQNNATVVGSRSASLALRTIWSSQDYRAVRELIRRERPDVTHVQNFFPLISPSVYYASRSEGVPVIQTLHNYRLVCPNAQFLRNDAPCEDCLGKLVPWPAVLHSCYSKGRAATAVVAGMLTVHRLMRTFSRSVDLYIAWTEFMRNKLIQGGLPAEKVVIKPMCVDPDPGCGEGRGDYALYVGRLSQEKGIHVLLKAWEQLGARMPLKIVGEGPMQPEVVAFAARVQGVEALGYVSRADLLLLLKDARVLIFPSVWYEGSPGVIGEAYSVGLPVIASNLGSMTTLIDHGRTGLHFRPGDADDLAEKVGWVIDHPDELAAMHREARREFESKYTASRNLDRQLEIYEMVLRTGKRISTGDLVSDAKAV